MTFTELMDFDDSRRQTNISPDWGGKSYMQITGRGNHYFEGEIFQIIDNDGNVLFALHKEDVESIVLNCNSLYLN